MTREERIEIIKILVKLKAHAHNGLESKNKKSMFDSLTGNKTEDSVENYFKMLNFLINEAIKKTAKNDTINLKTIDIFKLNPQEIEGEIINKIV